MLDVFEIQANT